MPSGDDNPFASPQSPSLPLEEPGEEVAFASKLPSAAANPFKLDAELVLWVVLFLLNLIVPALFSTDFRHRGWGVTFGVLILLAGSLGILVWQPRFLPAALLGSLLTAISQFYPVLQFVVGMFCVFTTRLVLLGGEPPPTQPGLLEFFCFVVTLKMGLIMIPLATALGWVPLMFGKRFSRRLPTAS